MGTSTSSSGGRSGSPFDPEWLDQEGAAAGSNGGAPAPEEPGDGNGEHEDGNHDPDLAPDRRFMPARAKLGKYLTGGGRDALRGAAKSMVTKGMGGARRANGTMRGVAQGAGRLGAFLEAVRDAATPEAVDWVNRVRAQNLSASDLALELIKEVMPTTGSIDDESLRNAAADALAQLYEQDPNVDIFNLTDLQIADIIGFTIANEVCNRMDLQLGQTYEKLKHQPQQVQAMRNDIKEWVHGEVQAVMEACLVQKMDPQMLAQSVLETALKVFAE